MLIFVGVHHVDVMTMAYMMIIRKLLVARGLVFAVECGGKAMLFRRGFTLSGRWEMKQFEEVGSCL